VLVSSEERRATATGSGEAPSSGPRSGGGPSPRPSRRSFSAEYKLAIVAEYENAPNGEKGAVLRREGLYSSHVIEWARARDAGALTGVADFPAVGETTEEVRGGGGVELARHLRDLDEQLRTRVLDCCRSVRRSWRAEHGGQ
jgi:transposase-like protein